MTKVYLVLAILLLARLGAYFLSWHFLPEGATVKFLTTIETEPTGSGSQMSFRTENFFVAGSSAEKLHFGDQVEVEGVVEPGRRLRASKIALNAKYEPNAWERFALGIRTQFTQTYESVLPGSQANLLSGVVLGSTGLNRQFKTRLADVGLTHIVAASGMNITLFSGFVVWALTVARLRKIYRVILSMLFILLYSTVTGFEPPIVRAALMAGATSLATLFGRQNSGFGGLLLSGYLMLWVKPSLSMSASFLLSFSAMMSQICLGSFASVLPMKRSGRSIAFALGDQFLGFLRNNFWQSFLAIVFTLPVVFWFFAKFSLVSLLSNMLILWTVEPLMILGGLIGLSGVVSMELARLIALPAGPILAYFLWVVNLLSGKEYFLLRFQIANWLFPAGYYLLLGGIIWWWNERRGV